MQSIVIAGYARSPFHLARKGALAGVRPDDLAAEVVRTLVARSGIDPNTIEDLLMGCAFPEGEQGFNIARLVGLMAGLPVSVAGATLNRFCGSSMQSIHSAAGAIALGAGDAFICAGVESMSRVPMMGFNPLPNPVFAKSNPGAYMGMGDTAENVAKRWQITRADQEAFAVHSQKKAAAAAASGKFTDEIVAIATKTGSVASDGTIRGDTTAASLAELKPAFAADGVVTAGTSSPLTDGAAAVLVCSEEFARKHKLDMLARIKSIEVCGCDPEIMGIGPVPSTKIALKKAGLSLDQIDLIVGDPSARLLQCDTWRRSVLLSYQRDRARGAVALGQE